MAEEGLELEGLESPRQEYDKGPTSHGIPEILATDASVPDTKLHERKMANFDVGVGPSRHEER